MTNFEREKLEAEISEKLKAEIREAQRQYKREWRRKNPDKVKAANERYWIKRAREIIELETSNT
jgi:hypothetical protein